MNMINSNPIEINQSSLVSLKAEILRKQKEINVSRLQERVEPSKPVIKPKKKSVSKNETFIENSAEDEELLAKSKQMLECKANLYDSLSKRASNPTEEDKEITKRLLVQFDRKEPIYDSDKESHHSDEYEPATNTDEEFVEYTDVLGRTRKCLRKDLEYMKNKDKEFGDVDSHREGVIKSNFVKDSGNESEEKIENTGENVTDENELLSSDMRRELMRREWEKQEEELLKKKDIHYQDVLFNEARFHGAGYYSFSRDEEERNKQQANLNKLRQETTKQQQTSAEMKKLREKQMAARLKAARNRKRARMGLPPEPDEPEIETPKETENQEDEIKKRLNELEEKQKQAERNKIIRPWDIGKEIIKTHYEHSQDEWVAKQRDQRPKEFAPPSLYSRFNFKRNIPDEISEPEDKSLFFTSKKSKNYESTSTVTNSNSSKDSSSLEENVLAGLRFLREQSEKRNLENS